jgi:hypothetical protein
MWRTQQQTCSVELLSKRRFSYKEGPPNKAFQNRYDRHAIIESVIEADPVADGTRNIMQSRNRWDGTASDFLLAADKLQRQQQALIRRPDWPRTPRAPAGRLRRAQTSLRAVGIDIAFHREGRAGSRMIRMRGPLSASPATSAPLKQDLGIEAPP